MHCLCFYKIFLKQVVLGVSSFLVDPMCQKMGAKLVWAISSFIVFICMAATAVLSLLSISKNANSIQHSLGGNKRIKLAALVIFSVLGFPLSVRINLLRHDSSTDTSGHHT